MQGRVAHGKESGLYDRRNRSLEGGVCYSSCHHQLQKRLAEGTPSSTFSSCLSRWSHLVARMPRPHPQAAKLPGLGVAWAGRQGF